MSLINLDSRTFADQNWELGVSRFKGYVIGVDKLSCASWGRWGLAQMNTELLQVSGQLTGGRHSHADHAESRFDTICDWSENFCIFKTFADFS